MLLMWASLDVIGLVIEKFTEEKKTWFQLTILNMHNERVWMFLLSL